MSKYTDTMDDAERKCPYCGYGYQPESEDYSEDCLDKECENCGMNYYLYDSFSVTHHAIPDCELNEQLHDYQPVELRDGKSHDFCTICDKCSPALGEK